MNSLAIMTRLARERDGVVSRRNNFAVAEHASASEEQSALLPTDTRSNFLKVSPADSGARNRGERDAICYWYHRAPGTRLNCRLDSGCGPLASDTRYGQ
jgi:hypothetical protein